MAVLKNPTSKDQKIRFFDIFEYILLEPYRYIDNNVPNDVKLRTLNMLITFFDDEEEYLKCHELVKIKNKIINND